MALTSIGILVALCATLTIAIDDEVRFQLEQETNNINYHPQIEPNNNNKLDFKRYFGFHKPHFPHNSDESGEWGHHGFPKPHFPDSSEESKEWGHHGFPKPYFPDSSEESEEWKHHGFPKPHFPHSSEESGEWGHHAFLKPHITHNSGHLRPQSSRGLREAEESNHQGLHQPHFSQEQKWGHKIHRPDWYNPHFPQQPWQVNKHFEEMERRRPLFYPIYPYHPYHLHGHPSTNDEEFETIEAMKSHRNFEKPYYHGLHNPNFPLKPDSSDDSASFGPFYHGFPHPNFKPFHKEPALPEENDVFAPIVTADHYVNGDDDDFPTLDEAQPYKPDNIPGFPGPFNIINNEKEHFKLPNAIIDILEHLHHGHGKPHNHGDKPNEDEDENEIDEEGSGEEEIIPLFAEVNVPLVQDNL